MSKITIKLIEASIELELLVGRLYRLFSNINKEDRAFWFDMSMEEENHAALLKAAQKMFRYSNLFPEDLLVNSIDILNEALIEIKSMLEKFEVTLPTRREAFNVAYFIETSAAELHFQFFMDKGIYFGIGKILKKLNGKDTDHAKRIIDYIVKHKIEI